MSRSISSRSRRSSRRAAPEYASAWNTLVWRWVCAPSFTLSRTVIPSKSAMFWNVRARPSAGRRSGATRVMSWPPKTIDPRCGL